MIPVMQTRFGGSDAPVEEQGNCFQACVASILEIPIDKAFNVLPFDEDKWFPALNEWLEYFGLSVLAFEVRNGRPLALLKGVHMLEGGSTTLANPNDNHVVVIHDGEIVHDPNPNSKGLRDHQYIYAFTALDPARWKERQ